jgi:peptidoglycan hydrolase-like protein with peptidoglycan-binding domain
MSSLLATKAVARRRVWPWTLAAVVVLCLGALAFAHFAWPSGGLRVDANGLPQVQQPHFSGDLVRLSLHDAAGRTIPVDLRRDGTLRPTRPVPAGTRLVAEVTFHRPGWVGWIAGRKQTAQLELTAPTAQLASRWLRVERGAPVRVSFDRPVREVQVTGIRPRKTIRLARPARTVALGRLGDAGSVGVRAVALDWERLPVPTDVTWFPPGRTAMVLPSTAPGRALAANAPLRLRFSDPVAKTLGSKLPALDPPTPGRWRRTDAHTLEFRPRGYGFGLDSHVKLKLPAPVTVAVGASRRPSRTLAWTTPQASELRLEELLALLRYLPLQWSADVADAPRTMAGQLAAAVDPPRGHFTWRYSNIPPELARLWQPGTYNVIVRGAIMAFQSEHDLTVDGFAGRDVWRALIADVIAGTPRDTGYSYVYVHSSVPQSLNLWHDGELILTSPGNTGVPAAPTQLGTFPVFEHIPVGTMSGTNPDGSHYHDPGIRWISYFNGGEGIHAFNRASFGTPQSLGCVELPLEAAAKVWPYTPIGTLVTVEH